jgi:hypothetical protein
MPRDICDIAIVIGRPTQAIRPPSIMGVFD